MSEYFKKLDFKLPEIDMTRIFGGTLQEGYATSFRSWNISDIDYFKEIVSSTVRFNIPPDIINYTEITELGAAFKPHKDSAKTALNYYINSANCITIFWDLKDPKMQTNTLDKLVDGDVWTSSTVRYTSRKDLNRVCDFKANSNEAWLLNVHQYHSVAKPVISTTRSFFRWLWNDHSFNEVLTNIEILEDSHNGIGAVC